MTTVPSTLEAVEMRRQRVLHSLSSERQSELGQFFTSTETAVLMASMTRIPENGKIRILDPGAGSGSLAASLIVRIVDEYPGVSVHLTVVEVDSTLILPLQETLDDCATLANLNGMEFSSKLVHGDFIEIGTNFGSKFDLVIMNPPYQKLGTNSWQRKKMSQLGVDSPNLYAAFMSLGVLNLLPNGQIISITPRSFTNGTYFESFRKHLLGNLTLDRIHLFESRSSLFSDSGVLQENIILVGTKASKSETVHISTSVGADLEILTHPVSYEEVVQKTDPRKFIRIPSSKNDSFVVKTISSLPATLKELELEVSTGRVVDFRSRDNLSNEERERSYPLIYPGNLKQGRVQHPSLSIKKPQWFSRLGYTDYRFLLPSGTYILIKRFSSKEERKRIVASIWSPELNGNTQIALDNKLNFIHVNGAGLEESTAKGLCIWLNSTIVDAYFRTFSGHTQVNASDLRAMPFPDLATLHKMAEGRGYALPEQEEIDLVVLNQLNISGFIE